ncbi:DNA methyltransferase [Pandoravirus neocaledonia]|uniref:site-specific DNA-methyltransferase (cytosine-N(4)-specific) n=1 Tax=Pandoravirus neocaledonia TaxID=2107708 RepID=A0A2U7UBE9_9VIRU|nr:DNA methyltransferase [Pandoravirus neocaledonia]AVK75685.1 Methyltransferase [Pandoravirus neocaledonia]
MDRPAKRTRSRLLHDPESLADRDRGPDSSACHIVQGDCRHALKDHADETFHCCVTSPPYWGMRDYNADAQIGAEDSLESYVDNLVAVFREVRRTLRSDGTLWLNMGDSFTSGGRTTRAKDRKNAGREMTYRPATPAGLKAKDLIGLPWRVALALQADGWYLRSDIIWAKPNCQPESVRDRPTRAHEYVFMLSKSATYYYDHEAAREPAADGSTRNRRTVWSINTKPYAGAHFATFPTELVDRCLEAGAPPGAVVLDPFCGSGTVGVACRRLGHSFVGVELNPEYVALARERIDNDGATGGVSSATKEGSAVHTTDRQEVAVTSAGPSRPAARRSKRAMPEEDNEADGSE